MGPVGVVIDVFNTFPLALFERCDGTPHLVARVVDQGSSVVIDADDRTRRIFYTALYHAFLHPSDVSDADGRYRGADGRQYVVAIPGSGTSAAEKLQTKSASDPP